MACIVTCIYDLKKRSQEYFHRSGEEYACMLEYHRKFNMPTYCFTESHLVEYLPDFVTPIVVEYEDLPSHDLIPMKGRGYANTMTDMNTVHPGHRLYSVVTNSKILFMSMVNEEYDTYVWLDSGIEHLDPCPEQFALESMDDIVSDTKSRIHMINYPNYINLDYNMYNVASGLFSIKKKDMTVLVEEYKNILVELKNKGYICLEEQVYTILYQRLEHLFSVRFTDYRLLTNTKYIRMDKDVILRNIDNSPQHITLQLVDRFLDSISTGNLRLDPQELLDKLALYLKHSTVIARILYHCIKFKNYVNDVRFKGRFDIIGQMKSKGITEETLSNIEFERYNSMYEYLNKCPRDRTIIRTVI